MCTCLLVGHNRSISPLTAPARHLLALLEDPSVSLDRVAAALDAGINRQAPPESNLLEALDRLAAEAESAATPAEVMKHVFGTLGFAPNSSRYYALDNSLLHRVLVTRRGNPISLAIVAIEIGRRLGVELVPVGMPAHFLVGFASVTGLDPDRWFDPFAGGREIDASGAQQIFDSITPAESKFSVLMLGPTEVPFVTGRILANIKNAAVRASDVPAFLGACELSLGLPSAGINDYRALGQALVATGRHDRAAEIFDWLADADPQRVEDHRAAYNAAIAHRN